MAEDEKVDAELARLLKLEGELAKQFKAESDIISTYEMGAEAGYDAGSESPDLGLMRKLAEQAFMNEQFASPSNTAAQFAMLLDPKFSTVFKDATSQRVNAARNYFARTGSIARQAQSERSAKASARRRSDKRLGSLGNQLQDARRAISRYGEAERLRAHQASEGGKGRWAAQKRAETAAEARDKGPDEPDKINLFVEAGKNDAALRADDKALTITQKEQRDKKLFKKGSVFSTDVFADTPAGRERLEHRRQRVVRQIAIKNLQRNHRDVTPKMLSDEEDRVRNELEGNVVVGGPDAATRLRQRRQSAGRRAE